MIDLDEINDEIARLEHGRTTYSACERLSVLYGVRNNLQKVEENLREVKDYSFASAPASEFYRVSLEKPLERVLEILDEHMEALRIVYPKEYQMVIDKLKAI